LSGGRRQWWRKCEQPGRKIEVFQKGVWPPKNVSQTGKGKLRFYSEEAKKHAETGMGRKSSEGKETRASSDIAPGHQKRLEVRAMIPGVEKKTKEAFRRRGAFYFGGEHSSRKNTLLEKENKLNSPNSNPPHRSRKSVLPRENSNLKKNRCGALPKGGKKKIKH